MAKENYEVIEVVFDKCPVCKKGKVQNLKPTGVLYFVRSPKIICDNCSAKFIEEDERNEQRVFRLDLKESEEENKYEGEALKVSEWKRGISDFDYCVEKDILPTLNITDLKIILQPKELCHWVAGAQLLEERAVRQTYGGAVRVMKGVYIGGSQGESHGELRKIDKGILLLTSQRLIFNGALRNAEYKLDKIVSVEEYQDAVEIGASNKQKVQTFVVDAPHKSATFIRMAINHLSKPKRSSIEALGEHLKSLQPKKSPDEIAKSYKAKKDQLEALKGNPISKRLSKETAIKMTMSSEENELYNKEGNDVSKLADEANGLIKDYRYKEAEVKLKKAISITKQGWLYCKLGDLYQKLEKYEDAIKTYKEAIKIEPDIPYPKRALASLERMLAKRKK